MTKLLSNPKISVVSPVYQAENIVGQLVEEIELAIRPLGLDYEIILVEDGSRDRSWDAIALAADKHESIRAIKLSRNFGQHIAITAALQHSRGEWVVVMDCDLQDNPRYIPDLLEMAYKGFDVVRAKRIDRQDKRRKKLSSILFYALFSYMTGQKQDSTTGNFGIYHRNVINAVLSMGDYFRFFPAQVQWVGFKHTVLPLSHSSRKIGSTSYSWRRLTSLALNNILAFSDKPLRLAAAFGFSVSFVSFLLGFSYLLLGIFGVTQVSGFISLIVSLFFSTGSIIMVMGIVGLYVGKTFDAAKNRPLFIVEAQI